MGLRINTNTASNNAIRSQRKTNKALNQAFKRLSSGLRINSAADDAAGLAISSRFTSQSRGLDQAIRNANDGISLVQTADSALGSINDNLQRMRELSVQAANGTLTKSDREAIQKEIGALGEEVDRVAGTTTFNGLKVLNGRGQNRRLQVGANAGETVTIESVDARAQRLGTAAERTSGDIDPQGIEDGELSINQIEIRATTAADDQVSTANVQGSAIAVAEAINDSSAETGVTARANATEVTGDAVQGGVLDSDNNITINGETITGFTVESNDAGDSLVDAINAESNTTGVTAARNAEGTVELTAQDGRNIDIQVSGNAEAITGLSAGTTSATVTLTSDEQFSIEGVNPTDAGLEGGIVGNAPDNNLETIDVTTQEGANRSIEVIDRALSQVSNARSGFGAVQNRLESSISNLSNVSENVKAANSRIRDADFASSVADMVRARILEQANVSVLSQANVSQKLALKLLGD